MAVRATKMKTRPGWNYETRGCLYQLWPPGEDGRNWCAAWTERRDSPDSYLDDYDDGWRPACDFGRGKTPEEALSIFPTSNEAKRAREALLVACAS